MQGQPKACSKRYFIISPSEIHLLRFILEAYEGIGLLTTMDSNLGLVELNIAPGCEEDVAQVLSVEGKNLQLRPVYIENPPDPFYERGNPKADFHGSRVPPRNDYLYEIPCGSGLQPRQSRLQAAPTEEKFHEMIEEKCPVGKTG